jgi:hypothetical protein
MVFKDGRGLQIAVDGSLRVCELSSQEGIRTIVIDTPSRRRARNKAGATQAHWKLIAEWPSRGSIRNPFCGTLMTLKTAKDLYAYEKAARLR